MTVEREEIVEIVCLQLGRERAEPAARLQEDLGADSADVLNLVVALEDRYAIAIGEEEIVGLRTVEDLYQLARALVAP